MSYYSALGLKKEPFSNTPDPEFFYPSLEHLTAIKRLEIAIRLRRGLSLILGDVGTGKTTLLRTLLETFRDEDEFIFHMMMDPGFDSQQDFLTAMNRAFGIESGQKSPVDSRDSLERYLFQKGVEENKTIVFLIDEGQKLSPESLEFLRTLLNYETNKYKLLQLVIMAQVELLPRIANVRNFTDRIALRYTINPLDEEGTAEVIRFRLEAAGAAEPARFFDPGALKSIYRYSRGYPRRIAMLCHDCLEQLVMREAHTVTEEIVSELIAREAVYGG